MAKIKIHVFFLVNAEFYRVVWTINALLTVRSEMLPFSGNNQNIKIVWGPPEHFAIGYVHNDNLPLGNIALQCVIPNNCWKVWCCFLMISCTFWRSRKNLLNSPKLSCGFKYRMGEGVTPALVIPFPLHKVSFWSHIFNFFVVVD